MNRIMIVLALLVLAGAASAGDVEHGRKLAEANCAACHALDATSASPFKEAPPFRDIHALYEEGELEDAFNDGIVVAHPAMPDWNFSPEQAHALAAFIMKFGEAK